MADRNPSTSPDLRPDAAVARLAATQHGLITRRQVTTLGMTPDMVRRRLGNGQWERLATGVFTIVGVPDSRPRTLWASVLHAGTGCAIASHTAGRIHAFEEALELDEVHLNVRVGRRHPPEGVVWHRQVDMVDDDVVTIDGLPVTSIPRTAFDLAGDPRVSRTRLRRLVESAIVHRGFEAATFAVVLARVRRSGKHGVLLMEQVLDDVGPGTDLPTTELERLLDVVIELAGLPAPVHEHPLPGARDRAGYVDRCWPDVRLVVEADGRRWHTRRQQIAIDHDRTIDAQTVGYQTTRFLWEHLQGDPEGSARRLRAIYEQRLRETAER
ncbi:type IV toxin-antitoxin system AbiEi family antitoxin domain-containing protein [Dermatobacter hominis]|uniref:type IV toxin-antitoxin system AbiEi family antitoxin domain-containing protein n=1 Tax=Dermatobacter hominis TaxID=2884263 RepID=UPI001D12F480|nr:type IV toxin-antitoxin system AbiEi family antitoxin domain-containing protein [Dermatobacter hominis]UDY36066.1 type IV toxin-antitoxin system AbiEi family antitoxin domain-containing protein [Dermatobacter hominis]